jgi:hypothetical protein
MLSFQPAKHRKEMHWILIWFVILPEIAGAAMLAPMVNPYESHMTKDEMKRTWEKWLPKRKYMYSLAYRFPKLLSFFYRKSFLPEKHDRIDKQFSLSLGKKVSCDNLELCWKGQNKCFFTLFYFINRYEHFS